MQARRALLKKLATVTDWEAASREQFKGESWLESRNTVYRFQDGVCLDIGSRDKAKAERAATLRGMRLIGWIVGAERLFTDGWQPGASAVLWRPGSAATEESMAMTSATTAFVQGQSSTHVQALHDYTSPAESQAFRRRDAAPSEPGIRPRLPSSSSYRSG